MEWQELEYQKRVAVARVWSDVLADKIIDEDEIKKYRELVGRDSVSSLFYDAKTFPLAMLWMYYSITHQKRKIC